MPEGHYFEKFIVDAFTGETLATYAELDGVPVADDFAAFNAELDRLFPRDVQQQGTDLF